MNTQRSALVPEPQPLALPVLAALCLHVLVASVLVCVGMIQPHKAAPIVPDVEVSLSMKPHSKTNMADKAMHAPRPNGDVKTSPDVAPPKSSDMIHENPNAKPTKGQDHADAREDLMRQLLEQQALADADSPEGPKDRVATDPDSTSDESINANGAAGLADPEWAKYVTSIEKIFEKDFHPLPTIGQNNPKITCTILVHIDPSTGAVTGYEVVGPSGNASYDASADRAAQGVTSVPLPDEKYKDRVRIGFKIHFTPPAT